MAHATRSHAWRIKCDATTGEEGRFCMYKAPADAAENPAGSNKGNMPLLSGAGELSSRSHACRSRARITEGKWRRGVVTSRLLTESAS